MRINVLGGGPAGLYFAILMAGRDKGHSITVYERNAPDDTFGFGVVFSDETLGNLEEAEPTVYRAITSRFAYWDAIDIHLRGEVIRSRGHGFCGMSRLGLLQILQARAEALGVTIHYRHEIADPATLKTSCDLLVCADGVNSVSREAWAESFKPTIDRRHCRYIWLGTEQSFPAFTFSFAENEAGVFQIHAYQFEKGRSTVIVECDEASYRGAKFDEISVEDSIAYCEKLFAKELGGHSLISNNSRWVQFPTIKNEHWHFDNVVLLGDAVHTAHYSIGSGTKLAMEDSIALAEAFDEHGVDDVPAALAGYEEARRVDVAKTQKAAQQSLEWFENVKRALKLDNTSFAFSLLTRSRRITHENLRVRDAAFVESADCHYLEAGGHRLPAEGETPTTPMFTPFSLREMTVDNRVVVSPMCQYSAVDGVVQDWHLVHLGSRAIGGAGLVIAEMTAISADARITEGCAGLWNETQRHAWSRVVDFVHQNSRAKVGIQIGHAGRKGSTKRLWEGMDEPLDESNWETVAPSALPYKEGMQTPRAMSREDMDRVKADYERATTLAHEAGFDLIELHMAHGYLLSSFLTPLSNQRDDEYGGSLENRLRFPLEVFDAMRALWPSHKPMSVRISATDWVDGGFTVEDAVAVSAALKEHGVDIIDVSTGQTSPLAQPIYGRAYQTPFAEHIRNEVGIPTLTVGAITTADQVNTILLSGRADLCALARPHLKNPSFTHLAAEELEQWDVYYPPQYIAAQPRPK